MTSGDEVLSRRHFCEMIKAGLSKAELRIIPPGIDCVSVVAADRNSPLRSKIMIFIGAVAGTLPSEPKTGGIFTDRDRKILSEKGLETSGDALSKAEREMFKFYRTVASASEKLYFSYPSADTEGEAKQPSAFLKDLYKMFPKMPISDDLTVYLSLIHI